MEKAISIPTLLVVDDSVENLQILSALLKDLYKIKIAKSGEKALEMAQQIPQPDLILLDVMMPGMDGIVATSKIREFDQTTPIISMTSNVAENDVKQYIETGMNDILEKPFKIESVSDLVAK